MYDIVVLGGGPGGYVAAIRGAQLGARVALIEAGEVGGTCLNKGCIPTKAMIASIDKLEAVKEAGEYGIEVDGYKINFHKLQERKSQVVAQLVKGIHFLIKKNKIDYFKGYGYFLNENEIQVRSDDGEQTIAGKNIIIATGSEPLLFDAFNYDGVNIITSDEALELTEIPESLLIVGGGVIGCEFATIYAALGTQVTIVEALPHVLPMVDKDIAMRLQTFLKKKGITIKTKTMIKELTASSGSVKAVTDSGELKAKKALISVGRKVASRGFGIENTGVELGSRGEILVNKKMQTNIPNIYAIGDVTNKILLAHVASFQGIVAAENIQGKEVEMDYDVVPNCVFTKPEVASVGLTDDECAKEGIPVKVGKFNFIANGKAVAMGETDGMVKIIAREEDDVILGIHIIGPHAADLISEASIAIHNKLTLKDITEVIHAHPTLSEAVMEAAEQALGMAIHA
ncbi:dihydrolipoyl dehydrogenase [Desulfitibacter alkalitolerans]|uniref:dihydrolipoyl dehydrogenase n=1 Tax=Desulfitibacter alkalitolerans TaxID=264641 RepID=UPI0024146044|nr:dihydrolipoyl dehydrogenase [Desulfitibacter alkalitolerans]